MDWLTDPEIWIALLTLTTLEVVLGIDNIVFISILSSKLPAASTGAGTSGRPRAGHAHPDSLVAEHLVGDRAHRAVVLGRSARSSRDVT